MSGLSPLSGAERKLVFEAVGSVVGGKWLGYLTQIAPGLRRIAVLHVPEIAPNVAFLGVSPTFHLESRERDKSTGLAFGVG
jgi:hypothetical protein